MEQKEDNKKEKMELDPLSNKNTQSEAGGY